MPQAIPLITGWVATGVAGAAGVSVFASAVIGGLVAFGTTKLFGLDEPAGLEDPGIRGSVKGTSEPIPIIYGTRRTGGVLAQVVTSGNVLTEIYLPPMLPSGGVIVPVDPELDNRFLNIVVCWCEGEIEGIENLYFSDNLSTEDTYDGHFTEEHYTGTDDQAASTALIEAIAKTYDAETAELLWSPDHRLRGIAYSYIKLEYDAAAWISGIPAISAEIKGKKVLDVRTSTTAWSDNPALCIYDYLTNSRYGRGIDPSEIDTQSFIDAANYCDQVVAVQLVPGIPILEINQRRYSCDALLNPDNSIIDNLKILLGTCRGALIFSGGLYKLRIDKPEVSTFELTADNIVGGWSIILENSKSRFNKVHAQYINRNLQYQEDFSIVSSDTFLAADNNEVLVAKVEFPATCNRFRAAQLAGMLLRQSRYSLQCEVTCTIEGLQCEVFDVVSVTHETPGWEGQLFRVMGITLESDDQVRLQLVQYADDVYDLDSQNQDDSQPPTALPNPRNVTTIALTGIGWTTESGKYIRVNLSWQPLVVTDVIGYYLKWNVTGSSEVHLLYYPRYPNPDDLEFQFALVTLNSGDSHEFAVAAVNQLGIVGTYKAYTTLPAL